MPFWRGLAFSFFTGLFATHALAATPASRLQTVVPRLPTQVVPDAYRIDVTPDARAHRFVGTVDIDLRILESTDRIVLNSADLFVRRAELSGEMAVPTTVYDDKAQTVTFVFRHRLEPGKRTLHIAYQGHIYDQAAGLFSLEYADGPGVSRALFTQFENADARRFFPCWDEPALKATFTLSAVLPAAQTAVSNMPVDSIDDVGEDKQRVHFLTTPRMSTYLLFYAQGDLERIHRRVGNTDVGVVVRRGQAARGQYALDAAEQLLGYYNDYFGSPYPLPKLDMVAAPGTSTQFSGMENWGAILYFEHSLLVDPKLSSASDREGVFHIVAHEVAHQWFGDLVTMAWWSDLWLNEGFASWMDLKASTHFHPEWNLWARWHQLHENAMNLDARDGTHPVITSIRSVSDASGAFDAITYQKGASVIHTLESYVGEDNFRAGVRSYLRDHAYGNAMTDDLWRAIDKVDPQHPVTSMAHSLTQQAGVPVVQVQKQVCKDEQRHLSLSIERLRLPVGAPPDDKQHPQWELPVRLAPVGVTTSETRVVRSPGNAPWDVHGCQAPVVINVDQTAYFRTLYAPPQLQALTQHWNELASVDQLGILGDERAFAWAGQTPVAAYLHMLDASVEQTNDSVLTDAVRQVGDIDTLYADGVSRDAWRQWVTRRLTPLRQRLGWNRVPDEPETVTRLRSQVISVLGSTADAVVLNHMNERFAQFIDHPDSLGAAERHDMLGVVALHASAPVWEQLHALARNASQEIERLELYRRLASVRDPVLLQKALELALHGEPGATVRADMLLVAGATDPALTLGFVRTHWHEVAGWIEPNAQARFLLKLLAGANDPAVADQLRAFAVANLESGAEGDIRKALSSIRIRAEAHKSMLPQVNTWLAGVR